MDPKHVFFRVSMLRWAGVGVLELGCCAIHLVGLWFAQWAWPASNLRKRWTKCFLFMQFISASFWLMQFRSVAFRISRKNVRNVFDAPEVTSSLQKKLQKRIQNAGSDVITCEKIRSAFEPPEVTSSLKKKSKKASKSSQHRHTSPTALEVLEKSFVETT